MDDVERAGGDVIGPDQVDQFSRADRTADLSQEQRQQLCLLSGADVQFGAIAPESQRTEDLQTQRSSTGRRIFAAGPNGMG